MLFVCFCGSWLLCSQETADNLTWHWWWGVEDGCWRCSGGKGDKEEAWGGGGGGGRAEDRVQLHSAARWWACRRGLCLQIRAGRWDRGLEGVVEGGVVRWWGDGAGGAGRGVGGCRPGNASCQTVQHVQHMSLSTYCSTMQSPLHP